MLDSPEITLSRPTQHPALVKEQIKEIKKLSNEITDKIAEPMARNNTAQILWKQHETKRAKKYEVLAVIDPLTGLYNRRFLGYDAKNPTGVGELQREFDEAFRNGSDLSVSMIDIDNFKQYNDTYGHIKGDQALQEVAKVIKRIVRDTDIPVRYGGEEFLILSPETSVDQAKNLSRRLNEEIEKITGLERKITISIGTASYHNSVDYREKIFNTNINTPEDLVIKSDEALYFSKHHGKNRFTVANELSQEQYNEMEELRKNESKKINIP